MYQRILIPLDRSPLAEGILPHATDLAKALGAEVYLLEVIPTFEQMLAETMPTTGFEAGANPQVGVDAAKQAEDLSQKAATQYLEGVAKGLTEKGLKVQVIVAEGVPATAILNFCREAKIDLIALSTHGRSGFKRSIFGSVADEVMRTSHLPVLVLRPQEAS